MENKVTATPSLDAYLDVIQRAGLPVGSNRQELRTMRSASPLSRFSIRPVVEEAYGGRVSELTEERAQKVQRLAQADQKLSALYSGEGRLASNNPFLLEQALNTATSIEGANIGATDRAFAQVGEGIESTVSDISKFYSDLITTRANELVGKGGAAPEIDWDAELNNALGAGVGEYSDEELQAILDDFGISL